MQNRQFRSALYASIIGATFLASAEGFSAVRYNGAANSSDIARDCAQDDAGLYVYQIGTDQSVAGNNQIRIRRHSHATGVVSWSVAWNATAMSDDRGIAIDVDSAGNVWVAGTSNFGGAYKDIVVLKLNGATGALMATVRFDGSAMLDDEPVDIGCAEFDPASAGEEVYIAGTTKSAVTGDDVLLLRVNNAGALAWSSTYDGGFGLSDRASCMVGPRQYTNGYLSPGISGYLAPSINVPLIAIGGKTQNKAGNYDMLVKGFDVLSGANVIPDLWNLWTHGGNANADDWVMDGDADLTGIFFTGSCKTITEAYEVATVAFYPFGWGGGIAYREDHRYASVEGMLDDFGVDIETDYWNQVFIAAIVPQQNNKSNPTDIGVFAPDVGLVALTWTYYRNVNLADEAASMTFENGNLVVAAKCWNGMSQNSANAYLLGLTGVGAYAWQATYNPYGFFDEPAKIRASRNQNYLYWSGTSASTGVATSKDWVLEKRQMAAPGAFVW